MLVTYQNYTKMHGPKNIKFWYKRIDDSEEHTAAIFYSDDGDSNLY